MFCIDRLFYGIIYWFLCVLANNYPDLSPRVINYFHLLIFSDLSGEFSVQYDLCLSVLSECTQHPCIAEKIRKSRMDYGYLQLL